MESRPELFMIGSSRRGADSTYVGNLEAELRCSDS